MSNTTIYKPVDVYSKYFKYNGNKILNVRWNAALKQKFPRVLASHFFQSILPWFLGFVGGKGSFPACKSVSCLLEFKKIVEEAAREHFNTNGGFLL